MLKAVITTLVLGTSTVAMADAPYSQPYRADQWSDRYDDRFDRRPDRFDRRPDRFDRSDLRRQRIVLANNVVLGSRDGRPAWVPLDVRADVSRLRLKLQAGRSFVQSVTLVYADGHRETMRIGRMLSAREPAIAVDLAHRGVRGILIDSAPMRQARGIDWRRFSTATIDVIGVRR